MEIDKVINEMKIHTAEFYIKGSILALWDLLYANGIASIENVILGTTGLSEYYTNKKIEEWVGDEEE